MGLFTKDIKTMNDLFVHQLQDIYYAEKQLTKALPKMADKTVLDAALINAAQAAEHYEIVRYGSLIAWARQLGRNDCASVLQKTLDEEKATDQKLTALAEGKVNLRAAS